MDSTGVNYQKLPPDFEGNFRRLNTKEGWMREATRLEKMGIDRAGVFGTACPTCYLPVVASDHAIHRAAAIAKGGCCACDDTEMVSTRDMSIALFGGAFRSTVPTENVGAL